MALEFQRKSGRRRKREEFIATTNAAVTEDPEDVLGLAGQVLEAVECLPKIQQQVILMRHMLGHKPAEICRQLDLPRDEVYRHLERGCKRIQNELKQKYGIDWRARCAGILGVQMPSLWTTSKILGVAAILSMAAVGTWIGMDWLADDEPLEPSALEATLELESTLAQPADASHAAPASFDAEAGLLREDRPDAPVPFHGSYAQVVLPDQSLVPFAEIITEWGAAPVSSASFLADENGIAQIVLPEDVPEFSLHTKVPGYLNPYVSCTTDQLGDVMEVALIQGSFQQPLRAVDYQKNGLEGVLLHTYTLDGPPGYFVSGPDGHVDALLAGPGLYTISMDDSQAFDQLEFEVNARSTLEPHLIPCVEAATQVRLRAVDGESGETLTSATFWGQHQPRNEFGVHQGKVIEIQMAGINGSLEYPGALFEPQIYAVVVRAPGYAPTMVRVFQNPETEMVIGLDHQHSRPARIILPGTDNEVASVTISRSEKIVKFPIWDVPGSSPISTTTFDSPLEVDSQGGFQLPFDPQGQTNFRLVVIDDEGTRYSSPIIAQQLQANQAGEFVFHFDPPATQALSLQLVDDQNIPQVGVKIQTFFNDRQNSQPPSKTTDENGVIQLKIVPGEDIELNLNVNNINVQGNFPAPLNGQESNLVLQLPPCSNTLLGEVVLADGQSAEATIRAEWRGAFNLQLPSGNSASMSVSARGVTQGGQFSIPGVPAGIYETTATKRMRRNGTKTMVEEHQVETPTLFRFPPVVEYKFRVSNEQGERIGAYFRAHTDTTIGVDLARCGQTLTGGVAHFEIEQSTQVHALLVMAKGYAPKYAPPHVSNELVDITMDIPGRDFMILDTAAEGILLEEGKFWIVDAWGDASDPRQGLVYEYYDGNDLRVSGTPLEEFNFVEVDSTGRTTGRSINVPAQQNP